MELEVKMESFSQLPQNSCEATKHILQVLINEIRPVIIGICSKLRFASEIDEDTKLRDVYSLCCNQIKKCMMNLMDVLRLEYRQGILLQESRQCNLERLQWCIKRLYSIDNYLSKMNNNSLQGEDNSTDLTISLSVMYFVNWIDHTFDILNKLANAIYRTDYKNDEDVYKLWKNSMVEYVNDLHISIEELLLTAMTLCRYCLPSDQHIVKARCQVVFRETKTLLSEIIEGDLSSPVTIKPETLRLPIMPSNVNILIDVLRNVLYVLETNTNTALLALLIHCFSNNMSPVDKLKQHFGNNKKNSCACLERRNDELLADCDFIVEFDLYNERLLQIGSFAVSCSSDENRTLTLRSGMASLEGLDPHLVPALMMSPDSYHSALLVKSWRQEVREIRDSVFLIVDPAAFADKSKQMLRQKLLEVLQGNVYNNTDVCTVINIGCVVYDFFDVYDKCEPDALTQHEKILPLLADLKKVQNECKIVSNLLSTNSDYLYDIKTPQSKKVSLEQLLKRLKLLYTIVNRINSLVNPNDNEQLFVDACGEDGEVKCNNITHTVYKSDDTYFNSLRKPNNLSRTIFARTTNIRSSIKKFPLAKLTKHIRAKKCDEISFSVQLERLFNETDSKERIKTGMNCRNDRLDKLREPSILYNFSPTRKSSMRRKILNKNSISNDKLDSSTFAEETMVFDSDSVMDDTNLQITDVLNQINDLTTTLSTNKTSRCKLTNKVIRQHGADEYCKDKDTNNVLTLNINDQNTTTSKHVWNIPIKNCTGETRVDDCELVSNTSTPPSHVTTMERICDIDLVESKLNSLKSQLETSV